MLCLGSNSHCSLLYWETSRNDQERERTVPLFIPCVAVGGRIVGLDVILKCRETIQLTRFYIIQRLDGLVKLD